MFTWAELEMLNAGAWFLQVRMWNLQTVLEIEKCFLPNNQPELLQVYSHCIFLCSNIVQ